MGRHTSSSSSSSSSCRQSRDRFLPIESSESMERHIQIFLNRLSCIAITIATFIFLTLFLQTPETCIPQNTPPKPHHKFPTSSCDFTPRQHLPLEKKNQRLWSSKSWKNKVSSHTNFFQSIRDLGFLHNHSRVLCVSAGAGHEVMAASQIGVSDVTGVELVDSPPLVSRADPHNLPFFDHSFDFAFSGHLTEALFPSRFVAEMERTVRPGGVCVIVVEECGSEEIKDIVGLFRKSRIVDVANVTLTGLKMTRIITRIRVAS